MSGIGGPLDHVEKYWAGESGRPRIRFRLHRGPAVDSEQVASSFFNIRHLIC